MKIKHNGKIPQIEKSVYIAPNACVCGDVNIGKNFRIMFGAQIIAENGSIVIGDNCIVLENAIVRASSNMKVKIGDNCLIGPNAHVASCKLGDNVFIATGASIFHGSKLKDNVEVRINGVVHSGTVVPENTTVPISWIAVGDPAQLYPPSQHDDIWQIQKQFNFPKTVYGIERPKVGESKMPNVCRVMADRLKEHMNDKII